MSGSRIEELRECLNRVERDIADHPLKSERVVRANEVIDESRSAGASDEDIARTLSDQRLPQPEELGALVARHTFSLWQLHRQKRRIEGKIARLEG